jgi:UDP-N-acetylglucosamine--N-acetylmuramyl-(pentapeptide) pyrophosphoryl-undecaprenol N-acetylglucosamine transferase
VRKSIAQSTVSKEDALQFFQLRKDKPTILVFGGSLGARSINEVIAKHIVDFTPLGLQVIWQTGKTTAAQYLDRAKPLSNVWANDFINEMDKAYAACRHGCIKIRRDDGSRIMRSKKACNICSVPICGRRSSNSKCEIPWLTGNAALMVKDDMVNARIVCSNNKPCKR